MSSSKTKGSEIFLTGDGTARESGDGIDDDDPSYSRCERARQVYFRSEVRFRLKGPGYMGVFDWMKQSEGRGGGSAQSAPLSIGGERIDSIYWSSAPAGAITAMREADESRRAGNLLKATQQYKKASQLDPNWFLPYFALGVVSFGLKQYDAALDINLKALSLNRTFPQLHYNISMCYRALGRLPMALEAINRYTLLSPHDADGHFVKGCLHKHLNQPKEEANAYVAAIDADPRHLMARFNLAVCFALVGRPDFAAKHFRAVIEIDPNSEVAREAGRFLDKLGI